MLVAELNRNRRIGVEYEFAIPLVGSGDRLAVQQLIARVLTENGLPALARGYSHDPIPPQFALAVEYDSSVQGESVFNGITWMAIELKTRPLTGYDQWEQIIPKALTICEYLGGRANKSCGHHVHLELSELREHPVVARSLFNLFYRFEPIIYGLVPPSRATSTYCSPLPDHVKPLERCHTLEAVQQAIASCGSRHSGLNLTHLFDFSGPRVELRYAGGTLDVDKARHWLRFCLQLVQHAVTRTCHTGERVGGDRKGLERLFIATGFKSNSRVYRKVSPELRETARYLLTKRWRQLHRAQPAKEENACAAHSQTGVL